MGREGRISLFSAVSALNSHLESADFKKKSSSCYAMFYFEDTLEILSNPQAEQKIETFSASFLKQNSKFVNLFSTSLHSIFFSVFYISEKDGFNKVANTLWFILWIHSFSKFLSFIG